MSQRYQKEVGEEGKTIGERLRKERIRLRMTQQKFGAAGGVQTDAQYKYESGLRIPRADYLAEISKVGADIYYIVTGSRLLLV